MEPIHGLAFLGDGDRTGADGTLDEEEADHLFRIAVEDRTKDGRVFDFEGELLPALACKGFFRRFAGFDLPARKLPEPRLGLALRPLRHQHAIPVPDHGADDGNRVPRVRNVTAPSRVSSRGVGRKMRRRNRWQGAVVMRILERKGWQSDG